MPIYEFECQSCGHRFEELVGAHVDVEADGVACPECGSGKTERLLSAHAPPNRQLTPNQRRRLEDKRGVDRGGAKERFKRRRAAEKRAAARRSGGDS